MELSTSNGQPLQALSDQMAQIVGQIAQSVVAVHGRQRVASSGVIWRDGVVVTAAHTLRRDDGIDVTLPDGSTVAANFAGRDPGTDVAVLKLDGASLPAVATGDASALKPGHLVLAVARLDSLGASADFGVIGGVGGPWRTWRGGQLDAFVRLDGGLYPGFSGAPLADMRGTVVGLCTSALARGAGMVIPASTVTRVADELLAKGRVSRAYVGIGTQQVSLRDTWIDALKLSTDRGLLVVSLARGGPAEQAGVFVGDIVTALDGQPCRDVDDLHAALSTARVGQPLKLDLIRGGARSECTVVVAERPQQHGCR
ncbi:S1C family serine protease [Paraburkholderia humisilvae]|uniref:Serine protease HtrA n=1 Tax=Paraburkholderia humisilvae TaxID=627669 RepID=A0A6J5DH16_9BURK|nr:trypsin-like peptidase domain-containing protein [Paraburkholderia humisilvae]CAB3752126.1 Putative serine protease HtrA [Paraburkholderia humisilvae]